METYLIYFAIALAVVALLVLAFLAGRKYTRDRSSSRSMRPP